MLRTTITRHQLNSQTLSDKLAVASRPNKTTTSTSWQWHEGYGHWEQPCRSKFVWLPHNACAPKNNVEPSD